MANYDLCEFQRLEGHTGKVLGVEWKLNSGMWGFSAVIASWSDDKTVRVWEDDYSGLFECQVVLEVSATVKSCAWSRESKLLAAGCCDATIVVWRIGGPQDYDRICTLKGHENEVRSVAWNYIGNLLGSCGGDKSPRIWEYLPGNVFECVSVLEGHTEDVNVVEWERDILFSASSDNTIKVWVEMNFDAGDWECVQTLDESISGHTSTVKGFSFHQDTLRIASSSDDLTLKIWERESDEILPHHLNRWIHGCTLSGYGDTSFRSVHWLSKYLRMAPGEVEQDTGLLACAGTDDAIYVFIQNKDKEVDGLTYNLLLKKENVHEMAVNCVKWHYGDRRLLASASDDGIVKIWDFVNPWPNGGL